MPRIVRTLTDHMLGNDEPDHRRLRGLVDKAFGRRGIEGMRPRIEEITDRVARQHGRKATDVDLVERFARPLPLTVICELLGLPQADRPKFTRWVQAMTQAPTALGIMRTLPALFMMSRYLRAQFDLRRREPRDDLDHGSRRGRRSRRPPQRGRAPVDGVSPARGRARNHRTPAWKRSACA